MSGTRLLVAVVGIVLSGCGLRVPDIQEFGDREEGHRFVQALLTNITCELRDALNDLRQAHPKGTFIDAWGVQTTLTLTLDEKGAIAPNVLWMPPSPSTAVFTLGAGLIFSSDATRANSINAYYLVSDLQNARCMQAARPNGPFLLQSDLKLSESLFLAVSASMTKTIDFRGTALAVPQNVIQHQVKFAITTGGQINPSWTLTRVIVNPTPSLFSTSRTRTHHLLITLGPAVEAVVAERARNGLRRTTVVRQPIRQAADLHFSASVASAIEDAVKNGLRQ